MKKFLLLSVLAVSAMSMMADETQITIGAEGAINQVASSSSVTAPTAFYWKKSRCYMLWTAEELNAAGINNGAVIKGVTFYGSNWQTNKDMSFVMNVYMGTTEETTVPTATPTTQPFEMTNLVYCNPSYDIPNTESQDEADALIAFTLDTPFTYDGGSLVMYMYREGTNWSTSMSMLVKSGENEKTLIKKSDNDVDGESWGRCSSFPVVTFTVESVLDGVKDLAIDAPAVRVMNNAISVDTESNINVVAVNGMNVASVNGTSLDTTSLPAGIYIVTVRNENGVSTQRFVKK